MKDFLYKKIIMKPTDIDLHIFATFIQVKSHNSIWAYK